MEKDFLFVQNLIQKLHESELLFEYSRKNDTKNTTRANMYFDLSNPEKSRISKEELLANIEKTISTRVNDQARYVWKGDGVLNQGFINKGYPTKHDKAIEGDLDTYPDQLWYHRDSNGNLHSYLDQNGMIMPGKENVIERINAKYGLNLNPNERITRSGRNDDSNNAQQFLIWRDKFFIPWYMSRSKQGIKLRDEYKRAIGELPPLEKPKDKTTVNKFVEPETTPEIEYDKSVIDSIVANFDKNPAVIFGQLFQIANGNEQTNATPQQIYNTILALLRKTRRSSYIKMTYPKIEGRLYDLMSDYRLRHKEVMGKVESAESNSPSWLANNGDYEILDKINNLFRLRKESVEHAMNNTKQKSLTEGNTFTSINTDSNDFDPSKTSSNVFANENDINALSEKDKQKKNKLAKEVLDKINNTLKLSKEVQNILDEIREINSSNNYDCWVLNDEGNTASLASKNAKIFKQNNNLCLSHDNQIEIFKSVRDLHAWLSEHNYPMPKNIQLHESVVMSEGDSTADPQENSLNKYDGLGKWIEILGLDNGPHQTNVIPSPKENNKENSELEEDFGAVGVTSGALGSAVQFLGNSRSKKESLNKETFLSKLKGLKEDETDSNAAATNFPIPSPKELETNNELEVSNEKPETNSKPDSFGDDAVDLGQEDSGNSGANFGDLNLGGYAPEGDDPNDSPIPADLPQEEYQIVNVLTNDKGDIQVEVKNLSNGKLEYKKLSEIDI